VLYDFDVMAYVVMPEHVHLLLGEPSAKPLSTALGVLKRSVSRKLKPKPLWLARYYDFNISTNEKLWEKLGYIHQNPVRRGLVERAEDYPWSSFRTYARLEQGRVGITRAV
jgi:putative transposase